MCTFYFVHILVFRLFFQFVCKLLHSHSLHVLQLVELTTEITETEKKDEKKIKLNELQ